MPQKLVDITANKRRRIIKPRLAVLHTTQGVNLPGVQDLKNLRGWFDPSQSRVSAHYGVDKAGNSIRMVPDDYVAFHVGLANDYSLGIEQVANAAISKREWVNDHHLGLYRVAAILVDWNEKFDIPLRHSRLKGVCQHKHVSGPWGHSDCGDGFPEEYVIHWAKLIKARRHHWRDRVHEFEQDVARVQRRWGKKVDTRPW